MHCCGHVACVGHLLLSRMPQGQHAPGQHKTYKKQIRKRIAVVNTRAELTPAQHAHERAELVRRITTEGGATRAQRLSHTRPEADTTCCRWRNSSRSRSTSPGFPHVVKAWHVQRQTRLGSGSTRVSPFSLALGLHHCLPPFNVPPCLHGFAYIFSYSRMPHHTARALSSASISRTKWARKRTDNEGEGGDELGGDGERSGQ